MVNKAVPNVSTASIFINLLTTVIVEYKHEVTLETLNFIGDELTLCGWTDENCEKDLWSTEKGNCLTPGKGLKSYKVVEKGHSC